MGVVEDDAVGRLRFQELDAARHGAHVLQTVADGLGADAQHRGHARGEQGVVDVEDARQLQFDHHAEALVEGEQEGKEYVVKDGDIIVFRFNV